MARKVKKGGENGTSMVKWDEALAKQAEEYAQQEANTGGGNFIGTRNGILKVNDTPIPNNELGAVVLDSVLLNMYFEGKFDPDDPIPPMCYAFGRSEEEMRPHPDSAKPQNPKCEDCRHNQFNSADEGGGKACKNTRRVALISAGTMEAGKLKKWDKPEQFEKGERYYLSVPPTSIRGFAAYVKQLKGALKLPPHGVFTKVKIVPDESTQFKVTFEAIDRVPGPLVPIVIRRNEAERQQIMFPWPKQVARARPTKEKARPGAGGKAAKARKMAGGAAGNRKF